MSEPPLTDAPAATPETAEAPPPKFAPPHQARGQDPLRYREALERIVRESGEHFAVEKGRAEVVTGNGRRGASF